MPAYSQSSTTQGGKDRVPQTTTTPRTGADHTQSSAKSGSTSAVDRAIEVNVVEVDLGKLASGKAANSRVKDFAEMMVKDHTGALTKLRALGAGSSDVKPNAKQQQTADMLSKLSGADFDREYMKRMVSDHQEALRIFEQQSGHEQPANATAGTSLSSVAQELLPTVRQHLQLAQQIQEDLQSSSTTKPNKQTTNPNSKDSNSAPNPGQK